jgi:hypothetical protein
MPSFSFTAVVNLNIACLQCTFETLQACLMALANSIPEDHPDLMPQKEAWLCNWVKVIVSQVNYFLRFCADSLLAGLDSECGRL